MKQPKEVETVTTELREALARVGVVLPSLHADPVSYAHRYLPRSWNWGAARWTSPGG